MKHILVFLPVFIVAVLTQAISAEETTTDEPEGGEPAEENLFEGGSAFSPAYFEGLLQKNPEDRRIYDAYAQTLIGERRFDQAIKVYERALQMGDRLQDDAMVTVPEAIREAQSLKEFFESMKRQPSWEAARTFPFRGGELTTNISSEYSEPLILQLTALMEKEKVLLEEILGPPKGEEPFIKISIAGRPEEYKALWKDKKFDPAQLASGAYSIGRNEIVVFFTGADVQWTLAHEFAHCFLRQFYAQQPSRFLDEGLANYLSFKLAKEGAKPVVEEILGRLQEAYDESKFKSAMDLFPSWERYEQTPTSEEKMDFYLRAWSLTAFFLDGKDDFFTKFFRDYLQYELQIGPLSRKDTETYFRANLSGERITALDEAWGSFIDRMSYETI
jgi:hypothetical protein